MHRDAGFTLIESMVAAMILAVAMVALGGMQMVAIHLNAKAKHTTQMAVIAQHTMEALLALPYGDAMLQDRDPADSTTQTTYSAPNPPAGYTVQWTVNDHSINPHFTIKAIDITVTRTITGRSATTLTLSCARSSLEP